MRRDYPRGPSVAKSKVPAGLPWSPTSIQTHPLHTRQCPPFLSLLTSCPSVHVIDHLLVGETPGSPRGASGKACSHLPKEEAFDEEAAKSTFQIQFFLQETGKGATAAC